MAKKRGGIGDGIKAAYHIQQAYDAIESVSAPKVRRFLESAGEIVLMGMSIAAVCGLFWLASILLTFFLENDSIRCGWMHFVAAGC